jgi:hypothetical protein
LLAAAGSPTLSNLGRHLLPGLAGTGPCVLMSHRSRPGPPLDAGTRRSTRELRLSAPTVKKLLDTWVPDLSGLARDRAVWLIGGRAAILAGLRELAVADLGLAPLLAHASSRDELVARTAELLLASCDREARCALGLAARIEYAHPAAAGGVLAAVGGVPAAAGGVLAAAGSVPDLSVAIPAPRAVPPAGADAPPQLAVHLLGPLYVALDDVAVEEWPSARCRSLFGYLLTHREPWPAREVLMEVFWPGSSPDASRNSLNVAIHGLRRILRTITDRPVVVHGNGTYGINHELRLWLDVASSGGGAIPVDAVVA